MDDNGRTSQNQGHSFVMIDHLFLSRRDIKSTSKLVFMVIRDRMGSKGASWPSLSKIADDVGVSVNAAWRAVKDLRDHGVLEVTARHRKPNIYEIPCIVESTSNNTSLLPTSTSIVPHIDEQRIVESTNQPYQENQTKEPDPVKLPCSTPQRPGVERARFSADEIEAIYQAYPRKVGKQKSLKAIAKALKLIAQRPEHPDAPVWLLDRVLAFSVSAAGQAGIYTPHPTTWFNRGSFDDDPVEWDARGKNGKGVCKEWLTENIVPEVL